MALIDDLQNSITSLDNFSALTVRVLNYLPEVTSSVKEAKGYTIIESYTGRTQQFSRPYNSMLFIQDASTFTKEFLRFKEILSDAAMRKKEFPEEDYQNIDKVTYTIQQSIGIALDLLGNQNANRKHVGNRFEELVRLIVEEIKIQNKKIVLKIPYSDTEKYSCETDMVLSPYKEVRSDNTSIDGREVVVSLKTSSKDRMGKIFIDKMLLSRFVKRDVKVIGIFLNDVQRKKTDDIGFTFVAGLFMVYSQFLTKLDGVFFVDPPPHAQKEPYVDHLQRFSDFVLTKAQNLLNSPT